MICLIAVTFPMIVIVAAAVVVAFIFTAIFVFEDIVQLSLVVLPGISGVELCVRSLEVQNIFINNTSHAYTHTHKDCDAHYLLGVVPIFISPVAEKRFVKSPLETHGTTEADSDPDSLPHCLKGNTQIAAAGAMQLHKTFPFLNMH